VREWRYFIPGWRHSWFDANTFIFIVVEGSKMRRVSLVLVLLADVNRPPHTLVTDEFNYLQLLATICNNPELPTRGPFPPGSHDNLDQQVDATPQGGSGRHEFQLSGLSVIARPFSHSS
jgi:hypothetical protein